MKNELPITGYLDSMSTRPGSSLGVHVSVQGDRAYDASLVRIKSCDPNPTGPGLVFEDLSRLFTKHCAGRRKPIHQGSYAHVPKGPPLEPAKAYTWTCLLWSSLFQEPSRVLIGSGDDRVSFRLSVGTNGVAATWRDPSGTSTITTNIQLTLRTWYRVWASIDGVSGRMTVGSIPVDPYRAGEAAVCTDTKTPRQLPSEAATSIAAFGHAPASEHFNGRIEAPAILLGHRDAWPDPLKRPGALPQIVASWDFARDIQTLKVSDVGLHGCHGTLINLPMRAVRGACWSGTEMCWRRAPDEYGAIHFHEDDLNDCAWAKDFDFVIPDRLASGSYALHLTCDDGEDWLPFFVLPPKTGPYAPIAVLMPTFSYLAYAAHVRGNANQAFRERMKQWRAYPHNLDDYPIYGASTYNDHPDGTGIAFGSFLRPLLNVRPGYLTFNDPYGSGLRSYPLDHYVLTWLEAKGFAFDVITDHDLHREGMALLTPYKTVITGSHPEYHTLETLDALFTYTRTGGHLAYLGGNGFYWRIAVSDHVPGTIEVRRAEGGTRTWASEPGEYYQGFDGAYGGLWLRNGKPSYPFVGIGFSAFGAFEGSAYRRLPASQRPEVTWMFEGVTETVLGDYGLAGGGAAGYEVDRAVPVFGSPDNLVVVATADKLPASFVPTLEDLTSLRYRTLSGDKPADLIRSDMVYFEPPGGGGVFSVGSITFMGSLWKDRRWDGPISRILENVVRRFCQPRPK